MPGSSGEIFQSPASRYLYGCVSQWAHLLESRDWNWLRLSMEDEEGLTGILARATWCESRRSASLRPQLHIDRKSLSDLSMVGWVVAIVNEPRFGASKLWAEFHGERLHHEEDCSDFLGAVGVE